MLYILIRLTSSEWLPVFLLLLLLLLLVLCPGVATIAYGIQADEGWPVRPLVLLDICAWQSVQQVAR